MRKQIVNQNVTSVNEMQMIIMTTLGKFQYKKGKNRCTLYKRSNVANRYEINVGNLEDIYFSILDSGCFGATFFSTQYYFDESDVIIISKDVE